MWSLFSEYLVNQENIYLKFFKYFSFYLYIQENCEINNFMLGVYV